MCVIIGSFSYNYIKPLNFLPMRYFGRSLTNGHDIIERTCYDQVQYIRIFLVITNVVVFVSTKLNDRNKDLGMLNELVH